MTKPFEIFCQIDKDQVFIDADSIIGKDYIIDPNSRERIERMLVKNYCGQMIVVKSHDGANFVNSGALNWIASIQLAFDIPNYKIVFNTIAKIFNYPWLPVQLKAFRHAQYIQTTDIDYDLSKAKFVGVLNMGRWNFNRFQTIFKLDTAFPDDTYITHNADASKFQLKETTELVEEKAWLENKIFDKNYSKDLIPEQHVGQLHYETAYSVYPLSWNRYHIEVVLETDEYQNEWFTDKVAKCLATGKPFVMLSGKDSLKNLKKLDFKTFDQYLDESYDECVLPAQRIQAIVSSLKELYQNPKKQKILAAMQETAKQNIEIFHQYVQSKI
jgi:hypothetical protein